MYTIYICVSADSLSFVFVKRLSTAFPHTEYNRIIMQSCTYLWFHTNFPEKNVTSKQLWCRGKPPGENKTNKLGFKTISINYALTYLFFFFSIFYFILFFFIFGWQSLIRVMKSIWFLNLWFSLSDSHKTKESATEFSALVPLKGKSSLGLIVMT